MDNKGGPQKAKSYSHGNAIGAWPHVSKMKVFTQMFILFYPILSLHCSINGWKLHIQLTRLFSFEYLRQNMNQNRYSEHLFIPFLLKIIQQNILNRILQPSFKHSHTVSLFDIADFSMNFNH